MAIEKGAQITYEMLVLILRQLGLLGRIERFLPFNISPDPQEELARQLKAQNEKIKTDADGRRVLTIAAAIEAVQTKLGASSFLKKFATSIIDALLGKKVPGIFNDATTEIADEFRKKALTQDNPKHKVGPRLSRK